jgi:S1-C subfamily serine protease
LADPTVARVRLRGLLIGATVASLFAWGGYSTIDAFAAAEPAASASPRAVVARGDLAADERNNIDVFKSVSPSVVHITTLERAASLFSTDVSQVPRGTGTGFMWDERGHIVTNFHVIQGANGARVTLSDQSTFSASLVGVFPDRDIAVLRIDAPAAKLKAIALGQSGNLQVGQKVYAIGNPFGLDQTLTTGIVSALNREIESVTRRPIRGVIQTDAAINPGNSGGPLIDSAGRLIGINTAIYSPSGTSAGIGFAIAVDDVNRIVPRLIRDGRIPRPSLGISAAPPEFNRAMKLPLGIAIVGVAPGSSAADIGLRPFRRSGSGGVIGGDLIVAVDKEPVAALESMLEQFEKHQPGDTVTLTVLRQGSKIDLKVRLGQSD